MENRLQILKSGVGEPAFNMAMDEALLGFVGGAGTPILRFYGWNEPAASFGYFQRYSEVERLTSLRPLVRRPTAGGIVPHDRDWTYSLVFPPEHEWYGFRAIESYRAVHVWLQGAFFRVGIETEVAGEASKLTGGECFAGHEQFDLLVRGNKMAGAAQRRTKDGLLIQGSIQPAGFEFGREVWEEAMAGTVPEHVAARSAAAVPDERLIARARELTVAKYARTTYNEKR
jgi:lipoate-protein ligase A